MVEQIAMICSTTPTLRSVDFSGSRFTSDGISTFIAFLKEDKKLFRLRLAHCNIEGDSIAEALTDHPKLLCLE